MITCRRCGAVMEPGSWTTPLCVHCLVAQARQDAFEENVQLGVVIGLGLLAIAAAVLLFTTVLRPS